MSDSVSVLRRIGNLNVSPQFDSYSKVIIHVDDETAYEYGTTTGRILEIDNPFGSEQMCRDILQRLQGYQYQPYEAEEALVDPAAEVGDALNSALVYGGIYTRSKTFGRLMKTDVSAPQDEEINHEYQFESPEQREFHRETDELRASLIVANNSITAEVTRATEAEVNLSTLISQQADQISAKVSQTGGNNASFGWTLTASGFSLYSGNTEVLKCDSSGLTVAGNISGNSGTIGGFTISSNALYTNNMSSMSSTQTTGVLLSQQGIKLGQKFSVDTSGNVTATNLTVNTLNIGGVAVSAATLNSRANSAYTSTTSGGYCYSAAAGWNSVASDQGSGRYDIAPYTLSAQYQVAAQSFKVNTGGGGFWSLESHDHKVTVNANGQVTIGGPRTGVNDGSNSFNIADTATYKNAVSAAYGNGYSAGYSAGLATGGAGVTVLGGASNKDKTYVTSYYANYYVGVHITFNNGNTWNGYIYYP